MGEENCDNSNLETTHELRLEDDGKPLTSSSTTSLTSKRRRSYIPPSDTDHLLQCPGSASDSDLGSHFSRRGLRATVCNAELNKARKLGAGGGNANSTSGFGKSEERSAK